MLTQEQAHGLNIQQHELEDAELQQAKAQKEMDRYYEAIKKATDAMETATPEQREKITGLLPQLTQGYETAKNKRAYEEDRYRQATNRINEYRALDAAQQPVQQGGQRRRTVTPPINEEEVIVENGGNGGPIIQPIPYDQLPENVRKYIEMQPGTPSGTLTAGPNTTIGDYLGNVWDGFTTTYLDPSEIVYQSNSRLPGWNLGAKAGRAGTVLTVGAAGYGLAAPEAATMGTTSVGTTKVVNPNELNLGKYNGPIQQTWNYGRTGVPSTYSVGNPALTNTVNRNVSNNLARTVSDATLSNRFPNGTSVKSLTNATMTPTNTQRFWTIANNNPNASIADTVYRLATK